MSKFKIPLGFLDKFSKTQFIIGSLIIFLLLGKISEEDKIQIIKLGFQLQNEGKISLKKYYEGTETDSLVQLKGYSIKYESIRRTTLYKSLKE